MRQKLLIVILALMAVVNTYAYDFEVDSIFYKIHSQTTVSVTYESMLTNSYTGRVKIPSSVSYNGITYTVTSIGGYAFSRCTGLTDIEIPNTVTSIGTFAFERCSGLTSIDLPNSITAIEEYAFNKCSGLTSIVIPNAVTSLRNSTFDFCTGLTSIAIPNSITSIGRSTFTQCTSLASVGIPNSVTSIGESAFWGCDSLNEVVIPESVSSIGKCDFFDCRNLSSMTVLNNNPADIYMGNSVFVTSDINLATLYVPIGSKELYANADQWRDFGSIIELQMALSDIESDTESNGDIYDIMGRKVKGHSRGIYIQKGKKILIH